MLSRCNTIIFVGILGAAALGTAPAAASAQPVDVSAKSCGFEFSRTLPMVLTPQITARGLAQCDAPPEEHTLTLALQYDNNGRWETACSKTDSSIPPGAPGFATYEVSAACYAGRWRMAVSILGRLQGTPFAFSDYSTVREVPSSQCPSR
ncbi:hypothetical protein [Nocardia sp. NPDC052112]|uniref:hypothetical protein n=1 Tax=Nocardia sp. NPDC052112 TaxID=3155646 RepID=UPI00344A3BAC